jgi:hypothetical protein
VTINTAAAGGDEAILAAAPGARVVEGDTFGSVGLGLTVEAARRYGPGLPAPPPGSLRGPGRGGSSRR